MFLRVKLAARGKVCLVRVMSRLTASPFALLISGICVVVCNVWCGVCVVCGWKGSKKMKQNL
jgi:hypothetical protein